MKQIQVNKDNYRQYKYVDDYRNGALERLTDEELKAQLFYIKRIYKGIHGVLKGLAQLAARSIKIEMIKRKIK